MSSAATCPYHKDAVIWIGDSQSGEKPFQPLLQWSRHLLILLHAFPVSRTPLRWNYICSDPLPQIARFCLCSLRTHFQQCHCLKLQTPLCTFVTYYFKVQLPHSSCSICHLQLTPGMAWLFVLLMLLSTVRVHFTPLPLFAEQFCNHKLVIACLVGTAEYLACFQMLNFVLEYSGSQKISEATVILL